jgi:integrase/recombinase XerD
MIGLEQAAFDYLALRRAFGYKLVDHDRLLADFCASLEHAGLDTVTVDAALTWAVSPGRSDAWHALRLTVVRGFARYLHALDPSCEVPPPGVFATAPRRLPPHIYTPHEIAALMAEARLMSPPLRAATFETLIGLMAVTGMRSGEARRLDCGDVDLPAGTIAILATKFNKSRVLAIHPTTAAALAAYAELRDQRWPVPSTTSLFVSGRGARLSHSSLNEGFAELVDRAGLVPPAGSRARRPRPHDLRHSFAVATLLEWYEADRDVQALMPSLSAWLGHARPKDTYWYLSAVPELLSAASERANSRRSQQP